MQNGGTKLGLYALLGILVFALIFAFLPGTPQPSARTGATLEGVQLRLYPTRDPDAIWTFKASTVTNDPVNSQTHLTGITGGQRLLLERDAAGQRTGRETLDATLTAPDLTIDAQDNLTTSRAQVNLVNKCADITMTGTPQHPVRIEQGYGFNVPVAELSSPNINGHIEKLRMTFNFIFEDADSERSNFTYDLDGTVRCVNGQRVGT